jgi:hypothetical protein
MKHILILALAIALPSMASAAAFGNYVPFSMYSAVDGTAVKSGAINVRGFKTKTVTVQGVAIAGHANAALSGTALIECGPTSSGPWTTCTANDYAQTAVSTTSNTNITFTNAAAYVRASWAKTAGLVSVWLNYVE